jgi:large subunit ribosomal protein L7/L12
MADTGKLLEELSNLTVLELLELTKKIEDEWGVSAAPVAGAMMAAPAAGAPAAGGEAEAAAEEKDEFTVHMKSFGSEKIKVIKEVRGATDLGLADAKKLVEGAPCDILENVPKEQAEEVKKKLEEAGAEIELK